MYGSTPHWSAAYRPCSHSYRLPCSLRHQEARCLVTSASYTRRVVYFNWPTMETRDEILLRERKFITPESTVFDSSRVVSLPLSLSLFLYVLFSFCPASSHAFIVKGEVAGGINMRREDSNIVESRCAAGVNRSKRVLFPLAATFFSGSFQD